MEVFRVLSSALPNPFIDLGEKTEGQFLLVVGLGRRGLLEFGMEFAFRLHLNRKSV